jgi:O-antigen ligase
LAAADLGRNDRFRHRLLWTLALSGMAVAGYSAGQRWLGWPPPDWLLTSRGLDGFSSTFFNYSASAAALNLSWPWLVFGAWSAGVKTRVAVAGAVLALAVAALTAWPATSGWGVAAILLAAGLLWRFLAPRLGADERWLLTAVAVLFAAAFLWQAGELRKLHARYSDNWMGVEATLLTIEERDRVIEKAALQRSDRLATSPAPPLPSAWTAALRMAAEHPLIGQGPGAWVKQSALYSNDPLVNTFFHMRQFAHHDLLQTAAEWGGLPLLAWLVLWAGGFYRVAVRNGSGRRELALVLMLSGLALHSLVHFPLQVPALQLWTAVLLGLAWSRRPRHRTGAAHASADEAASPSALPEAGGARR